MASGWLESVGVGVFKRSGDSPTWQGGLHALQAQDGLAVHVGGLTALAAEGAGQFVRLGREQVWPFSAPGVRPPLWFRRHRWPEKVTHVTSKFLPAGAAVRAWDFGGFPLVASAPERAILECLLLAPERMDLVETYGLLENLRTLRPQAMQSLLEACSSVKVKKLFMFLAERAGLPAVTKLARNLIDLGKGTRSIVPKGAYVAKYEIVVPRPLVRGMNQVWWTAATSGERFSRYTMARKKMRAQSFSSASKSSVVMPAARMRLRSVPRASSL